MTAQLQDRELYDAAEPYHLREPSIKQSQLTALSRRPEYLLMLMAAGMWYCVFAGCHCVPAHCNCGSTVSSSSAVQGMCRSAVGWLRSLPCRRLPSLTPPGCWRCFAETARRPSGTLQARHPPGTASTTAAAPVAARQTELSSRTHRSRASWALSHVQHHLDCVRGVISEH